MTKREIFDVWAPADSVWAEWAKPVLFAHLREDERATAMATTPLDVVHFPPAAGRVAVVLDLPCADAVPLAVALARVGYRPVPLYNAIPGTPDVHEVVPMREVGAALVSWTPLLARAVVPADAPPAFMLNADRRTGRGAAGAGDHDNRSISLPTDFPSAGVLREQRITGVVVVQTEAGQPQADLAHALRRWQDAGIRIEAMGADGRRGPIIVVRPAWYHWAWQRVLATVGLRRSVFGGYGAVLPNGGSG